MILPALAQMSCSLPSWSYTSSGKKENIERLKSELQSPKCVVRGGTAFSWYDERHIAAEKVNPWFCCASDMG
jgi:hypothetical protein